ncbi:MAG: Smr/MutS family protein [Alphaproteobacteria bacterium]|nr:Smr/MutS family protein [Alphaproteobacteria bacterium]
MNDSEEDKEVWQSYISDMSASEPQAEENFEALLEGEYEEQDDSEEEIEEQKNLKSPEIKNKKDGNIQQSKEIDKKTKDKIRKGQIKIDRKIDLHGMTQGEAFAALNDFVSSAIDRGDRLLLVITGKGKSGSTAKDWLTPAQGILKTCVPEWLRSGPYQNSILEVIPAAPQHGGNGAYYVYLRRQR